jgi:hypothetical protein
MRASRRRQDRGRDRQGTRLFAQRRDRALAPPARDRLPDRHDSWTRTIARRSAEAQKRAEIRGELQSKVIAEMIKSLSSGVPKERAMEKAFKAGAYWWQIGEHFGMSQQTAYETVKGAGFATRRTWRLLARTCGHPRRRPPQPLAHIPFS